MLKICPTCKNEKNTKDFNKNSTRKDGIQRECRECCHTHHNKHYHSKKSIRLKENLREGHKVCTVCEKELPINGFKPSKNGRFGVGSNCRPCCNIKWNQYQKETRQNIKYSRSRKKTDPIYKLKYLTRLRVNEVIKKDNITKNHSGLKYLGCDVSTYKHHLESQFSQKMSWGNHGVYWEVDHIKPLVLIKNEKDCFKYFHYLNTQPLTVQENRKKGSKITIK